VIATTQEARAAEPFLSYLLDGWRTAGPRCRCCRRPTAHIQTFRARPVGVARSASRVICGVSVAWRLRVRPTSRSCAKRNSAAWPISLAAIDRQCQAHDIERLSTQREWRTPGKAGRPRRAYYGSRGEQAAPRDHIAAAVKGDLAISSNENVRPANIVFRRCWRSVDVYEYSVLATSLDGSFVSFGQLYRDAAIARIFLMNWKNQWGWGGFVTQDLARCRLAARMIACLRLVEHLRFVWSSRTAYGCPFTLAGCSLRLASATRVRHAQTKLRCTA